MSAVGALQNHIGQVGHGDPDPESLAADFRKIMAIETDDGLVFDLDALIAAAICD